MNDEKIYGLQPYEQEADGLYKVWREHLEKFGKRDDYWDRVVQQACDFGKRYAGTNIEKQAGEEILRHVTALEIEWRRIRK